MFTILPAQRSRVGSFGSPRSVARGNTRRLGRNIGGATFPFLTIQSHERTHMPALALQLPASSSLTGEARYGFRGGVCADESCGVVMGWFGHPGVVAASPVVKTARALRALSTIGVTRAGNPRLLDRQDRRNDIGAGVRGEGDTR